MILTVIIYIIKKFQFQNGTIKLQTLSKNHTLCYGFNSKMVRLNFGISFLIAAILLWFQFQNGTIKFTETTKSDVSVNKFQFQNGTIKFKVKANKSS